MTRSRLRRYLLAASATTMLAAPAVARVEGAEPPAANIARGRPYTLAPAPNYSLTTDPGDERQLTDGSYTGWNPIWTKASTVGWSNAGHVTIVIDLQSVQPISSVSFSTAAGKAEVQLPRSIFTLVSDDGARFHPAGDLTNLPPGAAAPPASGYAHFTYTRSGLNLHGRYVALIVDTAGAYTFCDEIEVLGGDAGSVGAPLAGDSTTDLARYFVEAHEQSSRARRLTIDLAAARSALAESSVDAGLRTELTAELDEVSAGIVTQAGPAAADATTVLPLNDLHARIFAARGVIANNEGLPALSAWAAPPWDFVRPLDKAPPRGGLDAVSIAAMNGETRSGAVSLANSTGHPMRVAIQVTGLPFDLADSELRLFEAVWTDTRELVPVADALVPLPDSAASIDLPAGMTRQIWVRISPKGRAAGLYHGYLDATAGGGLTVRVPIDVRVVGGRFPDRPTLHVGGWDYTDATSFMGLTPENTPALIAEIRSMGVDTPWATAQVMPAGTFDVSGRLSVAPDTAQFDAWVSAWRGAARYAVFLNAPDGIGNVPAGDAARFAVAVRDWVSFWAAHAEAMGVAPSQLLLLLVDEPHTSAQDDRIVTWADAIRAADPRVGIFEDPTYRDPATANPKLLDVSDTVALKRGLMIEKGALFVDFYRQRRREGQALAVYGASGPARLLDPYSYYRLQPWVCANLGATGSFFWSFSDDAGGHSWNEYATTAAPYSPFLLSKSAVTISKHSEAMREGIEDFEYLTLLADRTAALGLSEPTHAGMPESLELLRQAVAAVLSTPGTNDLEWSSDKDRSAAERVRLTIADVLERLNANTIAPTSITAAASGSPAVFGQPLTLMAAVNGMSPGSGGPTGTVRFADPLAGILGEVALTDGVAAFTVSSLLPGEHAITASYSGDESHRASVSAIGLTVLKAEPVITWPAPRTIPYGTALNEALFNASANVPGTFAYSPSRGTRPPAGPLELLATFTPSDEVGYTSAAAAASLIVLPAAPALVIAGSRSTFDGQPHSPAVRASGVDAEPVDGAFTFTYSPGGASPPVNAGEYAVTVDFTSGDPNYADTSTVASVVVGRAQPVVTVAAGAFAYDGAPHGAQANVAGIDGAPVPGTTTLIYAAGDASPAVPVSAGTYAVTATFRSTDPNYADGTGSGTLAITPVMPIVTVTGGTIVCDGTPHGATVRVTGIDGAPVQGAVVLTYGPGGLAAPILARTYSIGAAFTTADPNYTDAGGAGSITIAPAPVVATLTYPPPDSIDADLSLPLQWTRVFEAQAYYVYGGSSRGAKDLINSGEIAQTSYRLNNVPGGQTVYLRLWTKVGGVWRFADSTFTAPPLVSSLIGPANDATNVDLSQPLQWTDIPRAQAYYLWGGSAPGGRDLIDTGEVSRTSYRVANPPVNGKMIYVRLWTRVAGVWRYSESRFTPTALAATPSCPANGAADVEASDLLRWDPIASAQAYYVYVGSSPGARDLVNSGETAQTSLPLTGLPDGQTVFVRLWTRAGNTWRYVDTTFSTRVRSE